MQHLHATHATTTRIISSITTAIGIPIEMFGQITCEMMGFCTLRSGDDYFIRPRRRWESDPDDDESNERPNEIDDEDIPGESARLRAYRSFAPATTRNCREAAGFLSVGAQPGTLDLFFPKAGMRLCTRVKFFEKKYFIAPLPCPIPPELIARHHLPEGAQLLPGRYRIRKGNMGYVMEVRWGSA